MLKAIHASEDVVAAREKAIRVIEKLRGFRLTKAAELAEAGIEETLTYYAFPEEHWRRIRTNNPLERLLREIRRRTRVVGAFPDGQSALNLSAARLRHVAGTAWSSKRYLNIGLLKDQQMRGVDQREHVGERASGVACSYERGSMSPSTRSKRSSSAIALMICPMSSPIDISRSVAS